MSTLLDLTNKPMPNQSREEYVKQIQDLDEMLSVLREGWMESKNKPKWMHQINKILEERFKLMTWRDECQA